MDNEERLHTLSVQNLSASYGKSHILRNLSLSVHSGEIVCLTGPNGSGKSTLLSLLSGIVPGTLHIDSADGMPSFDGTPVASMGRKKAALRIAYMIQDEKSAWNYTAREIILTGRYAHTANGIYLQSDYDAAGRVIAAMGLDSLADRRIFSMSGGEAQKVRIARALAQEPDMLLLDEPVANLDFGYQAEVLALIAKLAHEKKIGVLVSIHDLNTAARFADRIALLPRGGPCITGTAERVLTPENLGAVYNAAFGVFTHPACGCPQVYIL
jgi:iron complex transport system ATP-binding protein